jgi:hypothetical protein
MVLQPELDHTNPTWIHPICLVASPHASCEAKAITGVTTTDHLAVPSDRHELNSSTTAVGNDELWSAPPCLPTATPPRPFAIN